MRWPTTSASMTMPWPPDFCARLVAGFEQTTALQMRNGSGVRPGLEQSAWTELDVGQLADEAFMGFFLAQIERVARPLQPATSRSAFRCRCGHARTT